MGNRLKQADRQTNGQFLKDDCFKNTLSNNSNQTTIISKQFLPNNIKLQMQWFIIFIDTGV